MTITTILSNTAAVCVIGLVLGGSDILLAEERTNVCAIVTASEFWEKFDYMTTTAENCPDGCHFEMTYWKEPIRAHVLAPIDDPSLGDEVSNILLRAIDQISAFSRLDAQVVDVSTTSETPNLYVFLLHEELVNYWSQNGFFGLDPSGFQLHRNAYEHGSCSGAGFFDSSEGVAEIKIGMVFAPFDQTGRDLEKCIFEEFVNVLGLVGDPRGQASLFDQENYRIVDDEFYFSMETLVMLDALYEIASGGVAGKEAYSERACQFSD